MKGFDFNEFNFSDSANSSKCNNDEKFQKK